MARWDRPAKLHIDSAARFDTLEHSELVTSGCDWLNPEEIVHTCLETIGTKSCR